MSKRVYITHEDDIDAASAVSAVKVALEARIERGEVVTLTNDLCVEYSDRTKNPSFFVWRERQ